MLNVRNKSKNPHAVALGRLGGRKTAEILTKQQKSKIGRVAGMVGGKARAAKLTQERRSEIARKAAVARWGKKQA